MFNWYQVPLSCLVLVDQSRHLEEIFSLHIIGLRQFLRFMINMEVIFLLFFLDRKYFFLNFIITFHKVIVSDTCWALATGNAVSANLRSIKSKRKKLSIHPPRSCRPPCMGWTRRRKCGKSYAVYSVMWCDSWTWIFHLYQQGRSIPVGHEGTFY